MSSNTQIMNMITNEKEKQTIIDLMEVVYMKQEIKHK